VTAILGLLQLLALAGMVAAGILLGPYAVYCVVYIIDLIVRVAGQIVRAFLLIALEILQFPFRAVGYVIGACMAEQQVIATDTNPEPSPDPAPVAPRKPASHHVQRHCSFCGGAVQRGRQRCNGCGAPIIAA
jgi:hypothetical protein